MGFFSDLFGGESKTGMKASQRENNIVREGMFEAAHGSRDAINEYIPRGMENQRQAFNTMFDMAREAPQQQLNMINQGSMDRQAALLGGLSNYERAIMGLPTQQMTPQPIAGVGQAQDFLQNVDRPFFMGQPIRNFTTPREEQPVGNPLMGSGGFRI